MMQEYIRPGFAQEQEERDLQKLIAIYMPYVIPLWD